MRFSSTRLAAVLLALMMGMAACSDSSSSDDESTEADDDQDEAATDTTEEEGDEEGAEEEEPEEAVPSGTLRMAHGAIPVSMNPHFDQTPATFSFYSWVFEGLVRQAADGSFEPWLAEGWEVSDDGLEITFQLKEGIEFSDGTPFDAEAVKANIDFVKTGPPDQVIPPVAGQMANVNEVEVVDDLEVAFHLNQPGEIILISWLARNSGLMVSPEVLGEAATNPIGTGPYLFLADDSAADLSSAVFEANPSYWSPEQVGFERVEIDLLADSAARKQAFESGQYDVVAASLELGEPSVGTTETAPSIIMSFTVVDWQGQTIPALANKDVRCAMAQALNREGLVSQINSPPEAVRYQWAGSEDDYAYIDDLEVPEFDIDGAREAFEAAGGQPFSFANGYLAATPFELGSQVWAGGLNELGVTMENEPLNPPSGGEMFTAFATARYPIQVIPINEPHPLMTLQQRATAQGPLNPSHAVPPGVEELVQAATSKSNDDAEADIAEAWQIMLEECIWIPYQTLYDGYWVQDNVVGLEKITGMPAAFWPHGVRFED